jgi:hypothetical protein
LRQPQCGFTLLRLARVEFLLHLRVSLLNRSFYSLRASFTWKTTLDLSTTSRQFILGDRERRVDRAQSRLTVLEGP